MHIVFDIGGSKTRVAASKDLKELTGEPIVFDSTESLEHDITAIKDAALQLSNGESIKGAAGGIAGVLDKTGNTLIRSPNKPTWNNAPISSLLADALDTNIKLENDTAVVGLGEAHFGAGKNQDIVAYISVSTGVGGARIEDGAIGKCAYGFEPGHQIIDIGGAACPECNKSTPNITGELEQYISGSALSARSGKRPYEITDDAVWEQLAQWLAVGLYNITVHWSPSAIVLGGSMIVGNNGPTISVERTQKHLESMLSIFPSAPKIVKAELGDFGGLYGGLKLLA